MIASRLDGQGAPNARRDLRAASPAERRSGLLLRLGILDDPRPDADGVDIAERLDATMDPIRRELAEPRSAAVHGQARHCR